MKHWAPGPWAARETSKNKQLVWGYVTAKTNVAICEELPHLIWTVIEILSVE